MIIINNLSQIIAQIETERGISQDALVDAIEQAMISACRKKYGEELNLEAELNKITGEITIHEIRTVVDTVEEEDTQISLKDAATHQKKPVIGDEIKRTIDLTDFGRIAAQTAKQVITQRIREAEKSSVFDEFTEKKGSIITGSIQKVEAHGFLVNLGRIESFLHKRDFIPGEHFEVNEKIKVYVVDVTQTSRGPNIHISRTHPGLLDCLFELEVPEIADGIIEIKSISREPGIRAKVAVKTNNPLIGAVGTCVGQMGGRVQAITKEIGNERIDILEWNDEPAQFIASSLKPAKISKVLISNEAEKEATVVVHQDQLSLAIGKSGINVRLSVKLTGWNLDIMSEEEFSEKEVEDQNQSNTSENTQKESTQEDDTSIKVSVLAKELNMKTIDLIEKAAQFGVSIKSNRSTLLPEEADTIRNQLTVSADS